MHQVAGCATGGRGWSSPGGATWHAPTDKSLRSFACDLMLTSPVLKCGLSETQKASAVTTVPTLSPLGLNTINLESPGAHHTALETRRLARRKDVAGRSSKSRYRKGTTGGQNASYIQGACKLPLDAAADWGLGHTCLWWMCAENWEVGSRLAGCCSQLSGPRWKNACEREGCATCKRVPAGAWRKRVYISSHSTQHNSTSNKKPLQPSCFLLGLHPLCELIYTPAPGVVQGSRRAAAVPVPADSLPRPPRTGRMWTTHPPPAPRTPPRRQR